LKYKFWLKCILKKKHVNTNKLWLLKEVKIKNIILVGITTEIFDTLNFANLNYASKLTIMKS